MPPTLSSPRRRRTTPLGVAVCGALVVALSACSGGAQAGGLHFVYVGGAVGDPNYAAVGCGAKARAAELGATVEQQDAHTFSPADQIPVLNAAAASAPSGIMISPTDPNGLYAPLGVIHGRGIPVVTTVNELANTDSINASVLVDNRGGGAAAARYLADQATESRPGQRVKVAMLTFQAGGSKAADDEWRGFEEEIARHPNVDYVGPQFLGPNDQVAKATELTNAVLSRDPDLFGMFSAFGFAAEGILAANRQRGTSPLVVTAYSATSQALVDGLRAGTVAAIVDYPFRQAGAAAVDQLVNAATGKPVEKTVPLGAVTYTRSAFDDPATAAALGPVTC
jgi:ribose transport system substrate-binding protein